MMDLFRWHSSLPVEDDRRHELVWVHEECVRKAMEAWIVRKETQAGLIGQCEKTGRLT